MASIFTSNSSPSYTPYFAIIKIRKVCQSRGVGFYLLYQSFVLPHRLSLVILNNLSSSYPQTSITIYNLLAQSKTSFKSFPQNSSSIPLGLVILLLTQNIPSIIKKIYFKSSASSTSFFFF